MSFEKSKTELGFESSLAIFEKSSVNNGVLGHKWIHYQPISQTTSGSSGVIKFSIPGTSNRYIDLKCSTLQIMGKIVTDDEKDIVKTDSVVFVNATLHSLWSQVDLSFQGKVVISRVGTNYAYKAYLDLLLNSSTNKYEYQQIFVKDVERIMDSVENFQGGALIRKEAMEESKVIQLEAPLCLDFCEQDRYMINGVPIHFKFWPNKSNFYSLSKDKTKKYKFQISNSFLNVCTVEVSPAILAGHAAGLKIAPVSIF